MDSQQQNQQQQNEENMSGGVNGGGGAKGSNFLGRQSSTRWTPTTDQIRILKELYYNNGLRSPSAEQIQRISARLRQYGKIEGKNVFYWFQNHKARERQKKRFAPDHQNHHYLHHQHLHNNHHSHVNVASSMQSQHRTTVPPPSSTSTTTVNNNNIKYSSFNNFTTPSGYSCSSASSSSAGYLVSAVGQMGGYGFGSSRNMEKSFRECSISCGGGGNGGGGSLTHNNNNGSGGIDDPYIHASQSYNFFEQKTGSSKYETLGVLEVEEEDQEQEQDYEDDNNEQLHVVQERLTLPLFPEHCEDINNVNAFNCNFSYYSRPSSWYGSHDGQYTSSSTINGSSFASLELSLYSYTGQSPDSI